MSLELCVKLKRQIKKLKANNVKLYSQLLALESVQNGVSWNLLSANPNITMNTINQHPNLPWSWHGISHNENLTLDMIPNYLTQVDWMTLSRNPNLNLDFILQHADKMCWYSALSNPSIDQQDIEKHFIDKENYILLCNPNLTIEFIDSIKNEINSNTWFESVSAHPSITIEFVDNHINKDWSWYQLGKNKNITFDMVIARPNYPWIYTGLSYNPNITIEFIDSHLDKNWNWDVLSQHPNITLQMIRQRPTYPWTNTGICANPNVTLDMLNDLADIIPEICYYGLSGNPNLTLEYVINNIEKSWCWHQLSIHRFDSHITKLQVQYNHELHKYTKTFYWSCVKIMSKPPTGYYFLNDLEMVIPVHSQQLFRQLRVNRDYNQIQKLFLS
jgi:hypothetical protein